MSFNIIYRYAYFQMSCVTSEIDYVIYKLKRLLKIILKNVMIWLYSIVNQILSILSRIFNFSYVKEWHSLSILRIQTPESLIFQFVGKKTRHNRFSFTYLHVIKFKFVLECTIYTFKAFINTSMYKNLYGIPRP